MAEFHFGVCMSTTVDVRIDAEDGKAAGKLFMEAMADADVIKTLPTTVLDKQFTILGMVEGPLPDSAMKSTEKTVH